MKKMTLLVILSAFVVLFTMNDTFAGGTFKLGIDLSGDHEVSGYGLSGTEDVETGFSLTGELFGKISNIFDIGGGITVQIPRSQEDFEGDFYFIPLYALIRARIETEKVTPYFIGQLGYNLFEGDSDYKGSGIYKADLEGGLYWGLGAGIIIRKNFLIEVLYSVNNGTAEALGYEFDIEYSKVTLNFGYNF
ncbi:MAG: hypothetical protein ABIN18_04985 [Pseudomonadota bacterium]